ncbi:MAG: flagellar basal body P-ring formation protein FlgA [Alphaproteobacteria bacterium]|nr:flagellar basal body P-ring formation protein FlgA [Alphaproteobacteria bacterium]
MKMWGFWLISVCLWTCSASAQTKYLQESDFVVALEKEFVEQVGDDEIELEFFGGQTAFAFDDVQQLKIMISSAKFDALENKFEANAEIFADGKSTATTSLQGKYYVMAEVPVPAKNISKGEVIKSDLLKNVKVRMNRIKPQNVTDSSALIGSEAKRSLREGKLINENDIGKVMLIKKGDIIRSIYRTPKMLISAKVEALEDGGKGDKIEVRNVNSKRVIFAEVVDTNTVVVEVSDTEVAK